MTPQDREMILEWKSTVSSALRIGLAVKDGAQGEALREFTEELQSLVPGMVLKHEDPSAIAPPAITIGDRIRYQAVPSERELAPFLAALSGEEAAKMPPTVLEAVHKLQVPLLLKVYVAPQCPFCPQVVSNLTKLTKVSPFFHLTIIDAGLFPQKAEHDNVRSVPLTILDDDFRWTGVFSLDELLEIALNRDPSKLSPQSMQKMLESGEAEQLSMMMVTQAKIFPGLIDLLTHAKWPIRLGAMVVVEYMVEENPSLAKQLIDPLWDRYWRSPDPVKGDIIHIFGQLSGKKSEAILKQILAKTSNPELREAAQDALNG
jgi:glutaredoxin